MPAEHDDGLKREIARRVKAGETFGKISEELDVSLSTVSKYQGHDPDPPEREYTEEGDTARLEVGTGTRLVKTLEDAERVAEVDKAVWYVHKWGTRCWTTGMKLKRKTKDRETNSVVRTQQYSVWMDLRRVVSRPVQQAADAFWERAKQFAPKFPPLPKPKPVKGVEELAVVGLFDAHFGKLCWHVETGEDYDLKIADARFRGGVEDIARRIAARPVTRILLPVGNDFYHIDNTKNTTTAGTPQDVDGRFWKVIDAGDQAYIDAVQLLMQHAPVDVVWVPGNHDKSVSGHTARKIDAYFSKCDRVTVDVSPKYRKYVRWKSTLLGFTHGDKVKPADLPNKMAAESPRDWADTVCREWLLGHMHRSRKWATQDTDTFDGTAVRVLQSIAGTDAWHFENGYIGSRKCGEVYFYDAKSGYVGHDVVNASK